MRRHPRPGMEFMEAASAAKIGIVDEASFAQSLLCAMEHGDQFLGAPFVYKLIDDAVELAMKQDFPGFVVKRDEVA
jgi:hypothetical protein